MSDIINKFERYNGTLAAEEAAIYWAEVFNRANGISGPKGKLVKTGAFLGGSLASLWTPDAALHTALVLATAGLGSAYLKASTLTVGGSMKLLQAAKSFGHLGSKFTIRSGLKLSYRISSSMLKRALGATLKALLSSAKALSRVAISGFVKILGASIRILRKSKAIVNELGIMVWHFSRRLGLSIEQMIKSTKTLTRSTQEILLKFFSGLKKHAISFKDALRSAYHWMQFLCYHILDRFSKMGIDITNLTDEALGVIDNIDKSFKTGYQIGQNLNQAITGDYRIEKRFILDSRGIEDGVYANLYQVLFSDHTSGKRFIPDSAL